MRYSTIIPAAGKGQRLGLGYNKILYRNNDLCILEKTIIPFLNDDECQEIVIVCSKDDIEYITSLIKNEKVEFVLGGATREESVYCGLKVIKEDYVLIHDAARPFVSKRIIEDIKVALMSYQSVIPTVKSKDATLINGKYEINSKVDLIQTPQAFHSSIIIKAMEYLKKNNEFANYKDDASIVQDKLGIIPFLVEGDYNNIKITTNSDLKTLEASKNE